MLTLAVYQSYVLTIPGRKTDDGPSVRASHPSPGPSPSPSPSPGLSSSPSPRHAVQDSVPRLKTPFSLQRLRVTLDAYREMVGIDEMGPRTTYVLGSRIINRGGQPQALLGQSSAFVPLLLCRIRDGDPVSDAMLQKQSLFRFFGSSFFLPAARSFLMPDGRGRGSCWARCMLQARTEVHA